tara:strand:- start:241 stop:474 length:234 start_codon:yes stop_codon:yes gene_type:complete
MIKSFECYTRHESVTLGSGYLPATRWNKRHDDGQTSSLYVSDIGVTRALVREAFEAQGHGVTINCFSRADSGYAWVA